MTSTAEFSDEALLEGFAGATRIRSTDGRLWACRIAGSKLLVWEPPEGHSPNA